MEKFSGIKRDGIITTHLLSRIDKLLTSNDRELNKLGRLMCFNYAIPYYVVASKSLLTSKSYIHTYTLRGEDIIIGTTSKHKDIRTIFNIYYQHETYKIWKIQPKCGKRSNRCLPLEIRSYKS